MTMLQAPWPPVPGAPTISGQVLRLKNTTDFPNNTVLDVVTVCLSELGLDMSDFDITLSNYKYVFMGRCYTAGCCLHTADPHKPLVTARITSKESAFPYWVNYPDTKRSSEAKEGTGTYRAKSTLRRGYISHWLLSREEGLVHVLSHEIRHVWQINHKRGWVLGARGRHYSDRDADAFAIRVVRAWRRRKARRESEVALQRAASLLFSLHKLLAAALAAKYRRLDLTA